MRYEDIKSLGASKFRRLVGVLPTTFEQMLEAVSTAKEKEKKISGRPSKLSLEDQLLMTLGYLREYRTYFHTGKSYGVSESTCFKIVRWVEETLVRDVRFRLPGKKQLQKSEMPIEVIVVDATETQCERPKKKDEEFRKGIFTRERRSATR